MAVVPLPLFAISAVIVGTCLFSRASAVVTITPEADPPLVPGAYYAAESKIALVCSTDRLETPVAWTWTNFTNNSTMPAANVSGIQVLGGGRIELPKQIGGNFECTDGADTKSYYVNRLSDDVLFPHHEETNGTLDRVLLRCDQRFSADMVLPLIWLNSDGIILNNAVVDDKAFKNYTLDGREKGYSLTIRNRERLRYPLKTGEYRCRLDTAGVQTTHGPVGEKDKPFERTIRYSSKPDVRIEGVSQAKTKSATMDETLKLQCVLNSDSSRTYAVWKYQNLTAGNASLETLMTSNITDQALPDLHWENLPRCSADPSKRCSNDRVFSLEQKNSTTGQYERVVSLEFGAVRDADKGVYTCEVHEFDALGRDVLNSQEVTLKVKDKLAALWPFLGIVAEVVILCLIIFLYEKRRNKSVDEEDETEPMKGEVHETRDTVVRSRK